jgi:epoxyqueuosine reductase
MRNKLIPYRKDLRDKARELRKFATASETALWNEIRNRKIGGYQFHRQVPLLDYIVDFYCHELMLAIEIDGDSHATSQARRRDQNRQHRLEKEGIHFIRFTDREVRNQAELVVSKIADWIKVNTPLNPPSRGEIVPPPLRGAGGVSSYTAFIKQTATQLGFSYCGISKAQFLEDEAPKLDEWLRRNYHGKMAYMANHFEKRLDPTKLVPGAKSVISLIYNYYPEIDLAKTTNLKIAKYAYGEDYHFVIKEKLKEFMYRLQEKLGDVNGRAFVDSAPVLERVWAKRSGIGWMGKNSLLLNRSLGSFFFLAELVVDIELEYDGPIKDYCGTCTACMDACPTDAIPQPYVVDGSKCISYFTIELKEEIPNEVKGKFENWIFGCDICQDVCPWNRFSQPHREPRFNANPELATMTNADWQELTEEVFNKVFKKSAVKRTGYKGLRRNIQFISDAQH